MTDIEPRGTVQKIFDLLQRRIWLGPLLLFLALLLGLGLGLLTGWVIAPVSWTPNVDELRAIADSYALNNDLPLAQRRLKNVSIADQTRLFKQIISDSAGRSDPGQVQRVTALTHALGLDVGSGGPTPSVPTPAAAVPSIGSVAPFLLGGAIVLALAFAVGGGIFFVRVALPRIRAARQRQPDAEIEIVPEEVEAPAPVARVSPAPPSANLASLGRYQATYTAGKDNYEEQFPFERGQDFMGECGVGVSETIGDGLPDKITAFDLWLFDKTDAHTVSHILMSEYAFKDPTLRTKLQSKGNAIVLATKNETTVLETHSLRIEARILDLVYASNPSLPANSYFQKLVVEIAAFRI